VDQKKKAEKMKSEFRTTQTGWLVIVVVGIIAAGTASRAIVSGADNSLWIVVFILVLVLLFFYRLTVTVNDREVKFKMGIGWFGRTYLLSDISSCRPVTNQCVLGWGIRFWFTFILYNVSGIKAIELTFRDNSLRVRIGTKEPERLAEEINKKLAQLQPVT
jgi:hypothetical protein